MTFSLALEGKDLKLIGSQLGVVYGTAKLAQDLDAWLREEFQGDRFHPNYGSVLDGFIGGLVSDLVQFQIEQEVYRVLSNYQQVQTQALRDDPSRFSYDELLGDITSVTSVVQYDAIIVTIQYSPYRGPQQQLQVTVSQ